MGLEEDAVDLGEVDGLDAIADGLEECSEAEVSDAAEDAFGGACDEGEGVVGQQPRLAPGESFRYGSYCPLATEWGTMEGTFTLVPEDGTRFDARVRRFYLVGSPE